MSQQISPRLPVIDVQHRSNLVPLTEDQVRFEIDMCIGCDRCLRACPLPSSSLITIADLNLATISDTITQPVTRFTHECVMCGSCVPVCPVNNHRDLLMLSLKQRLGVPWDGTVDMSRVFQYLPPGWSLNLLLSRLREVPLFRDAQQIPDHYLHHFIASSKILLLTPGAIVLQEGEYGRDLYLLLDGRLSVASSGPKGEEMAIAVLQRGEFIGEYGILTGLPCPVTARVLAPTVLLKVPEQVMQRMMELAPSVKHFFERYHEARSVELVMKRLALFQGVRDADFKDMARRVQFRTYDRDVPIFSEADKEATAREPLCIILEGFVKVARRTSAGMGHNRTDERIIAYRQGGDYFFGGRDSLGDGRAISVTTINRTRVAIFVGRLEQYRSMANMAQVMTGPLSSVRVDEEKPFSEAEARASLRSLVGEGVVEGTDVLVIDLDKCVHCDKCVEACTRRHGHSRMNRSGMVVGNISIATACRQCQDPVCMLCNRAGIARLPSGEVYITESCIGCGICAERCPYHNISIISLTEEEETKSNDSLWQRFTRFFSEGAGKEQGKKLLPMVTASSPNEPSMTDPLETMRKKVAVKCDLCAGYNNQACVQACPTGAAFRTHPIQFFGSTDEILLRRAR
ncbi:MAG: cyclic nucleotide-binding domain-containing protein [Chloroflexi bacterium]|nr:MAG: cyclic nucleotide-binding domain-containing protein [Chloroflexota bacterium]